MDALDDDAPGAGFAFAGQATLPPVVFYGRCQMQALSVVYGLLAGGPQGIPSVWMKSGRRLTAEEREIVARADTVVEQITPMQGVVALPGAPAGARRVRVPLVDGSFLWPFSSTGHPESRRRYRGYDPFRSEMGDSWLVGRLRNGIAPAYAADAYMDLDIARAAHLSRRMELVLGLQAARDGQTAFRFADVIEQKFRTVKLFRTPYHLEAPLLRLMLTTLLAEMDTPSDIAARAGGLLTGSVFPVHENAVHPHLAAHFGLNWVGEATTYSFWKETVLTFAEWVQRFVHCEAYPQVHEVFRALKQNREDAAARVADALRIMPDSPWLLHAAGVILQRAGRIDDALGFLGRSLQLRPSHAAAWREVGECLAQQGRLAEAIGAMERAVALERFNAGLQHRLAELLVQNGETQRAVMPLQIALMLQPHRSAFRTLAEACGLQAVEA